MTNLEIVLGRHNLPLVVREGLSTENTFKFRPKTGMTARETSSAEEPRNILGKQSACPKSKQESQTREGVLSGVGSLILSALAPKRVKRGKASGAVLKESPSIFPAKPETGGRCLKSGGPHQEDPCSQPSTWERWMGILLCKVPRSKRHRMDGRILGL